MSEAVLADTEAREAPAGRILTEDSATQCVVTLAGTTDAHHQRLVVAPMGRDSLATFSKPGIIHRHALNRTGMLLMTKLRFATAAVILVMVGAMPGQRTAIADDRDKLVGTWKLVAAVSEDLATGQKTNIYKAPPVGFINYGADGRVLVIVVDSDRKKPAGAVATPAEAEALFRSMAAYGGTYVVKGNQVIHHVDVSWNQTWTGTDQVRNYKFDGERLSLATAPSPDPFTGKMSVRTLVWEKIK
ncbi:MAG: lipocalin-like domain-containing protein [Xanthobacteraceae bacterium]